MRPLRKSASAKECWNHAVFSFRNKPLELLNTASNASLVTYELQRADDQ